jgi:hypothetical protein
MRVEMRTVVRVLSTFAMLLAFVVVAGADAQAQRRGRVEREVTVERPDNGLHRGWYVGRHRGWAHSRHYGVTSSTTVVTTPRYRRDRVMRRAVRDERVARRERVERMRSGDRVTVTRVIERRRLHERP